MNPPHPLDPSTIQGQYNYSHPLYTPEAVAAQKHLPKIQGKRGIYYCSAWTRYGFHEDGFSSGLEIATKHLGAKIPFDPVDARYSRGMKPEFGTKDYAARAMIGFIQPFIMLIERALDFTKEAIMFPWNAAMWFLERAVATVVWLLTILGIVQQGTSQEQVIA